MNISDIRFVVKRNKTQYTQSPSNIILKHLFQLKVLISFADENEEFVKSNIVTGVLISIGILRPEQLDFIERQLMHSYPLLGNRSLERAKLNCKPKAYSICHIDLET